MIYFWILVALCSLSLALIIFLLAFRVYLSRKLAPQELCAGIAAAAPFLNDSELKTKAAEKTKSAFILGARIFGAAASLAKKVHFVFLKKRMESFKNYVNGRQAVEGNGCKGYWHQLNGKKKPPR